MNNQCVNALYRASPISTFIKKALGAWYNSVSMPYIGLLPFLPTETQDVAETPVCQCPTSGFSHFYLSQNLSQNLNLSVSMPYIGLLPFLQYPLKNLIKSMVSGTVFRG